MYEGNPVELRMEKTISADGSFDEATRQGKVYKYAPEEANHYVETMAEEIIMSSQAAT